MCEREELGYSFKCAAAAAAVRLLAAVVLPFITHSHTTTAVQSKQSCIPWDEAKADVNRWVQIIGGKKCTKNDFCCFFFNGRCIKKRTPCITDTIINYVFNSS